MNNQEKILDIVYGYPGNCTDVMTISKWTGLEPKSIYKALEHLKHRGAIKKKEEIFIEKNHPPIRKIKVIITPKTKNKALWILNNA